MDKLLTNLKRKAADKPDCKYGLACYQKNPEHHKKFKHPPPVKDNVFSRAGKVSDTEDDNGNFLSDAPEVDLPKTCEVDAAANAEDKSCPDIYINKSSDAGDNGETVQEIFKTMPKDFFDFWKFCSSLNKSKPENAFLNFGYKLVGVYDLLAKKLPSDQRVDISCHWRYYYDPPEFQTVIKKKDKDMFHIGYFRDDPSDMPSILASNSAAVDAKLTLEGDNIFAAMNSELKDEIKSMKSKDLKSKATKVQQQLEKFAKQEKYSLQTQTDKTKKRQKKVVAKTFNGLGIVVPFKNDIGYRPLPDSNATMKSIFQKIASAKTEAQKLECEETLDEIITNIHFANDECDYGMGLELGIDLFCFGDSSLNKYVLTVLPLAYKLLKRPKYANIVEAHMKNRSRNLNLSTLA